MDIFFALKVSKLFNSYLLSLQLVLCCVAAIKSLPHSSLVQIIFNVWSYQHCPTDSHQFMDNYVKPYCFVWYLYLNDQRMFSRNSKIVICLDSYSKQIYNSLVIFRLITVFETTALFNLPICSIFLWLLLPDIIGLLMRLL